MVGCKHRRGSFAGFATGGGLYYQGVEMAKVRLEFLSWLTGTLGEARAGKNGVVEVTTGKDTTVREVLGQMATAHPRFGELVFDAQTKKLSAKVAVFYNGQHLEFANGLNTVLKDGDVLTLLPPIEGG